MILNREVEFEDKNIESREKRKTTKTINILFINRGKKKRNLDYKYLRLYICDYNAIGLLFFYSPDNSII